MADTNEAKKRLLDAAKKLMPYDLPIGIYLVTKEGEFVICNSRVREILNLPQAGETIEANLRDFYDDPNVRKILMHELEEAEKKGKFLEKKVVRFKIGEKKIWVQVYCRSVIEPDSGKVIGYVGCLVDVTEEESMYQLFERLPVGVYKLDAHNKILQVNQAFANILGYSKPMELEGVDIKSLYVDPVEATKFDRKILEQGTVENEIVELLKKNKERCHINVCAFKKTAPDGVTYLGREGTIQDVTDEENYRQIRDTLPVGTYLIKVREDGKEVFWQCNKAFADMFQYDIQELRGKEVKDLYASEKDYKYFVKGIIEKYKQGEVIEGIPIRARTSKNQSITLETYCRILTDGDGNITGRVGLVLDISNKVALRELRDDIGRILHFYSAALVTLEQSIKPVLRALGPDPFEIDTLLTVENAAKALKEPANNLKESLIRMLQKNKVSQERLVAIIGADTWNTLVHYKNLLEKYKTVSPYLEFQVATLHAISGKILDILNKIGKDGMDEKRFRNSLQKAKELERICCLIKTHQALDTIMDVDYPMRALREYVSFQDRKPDQPVVCSISSLIQTCVFQLYPFAQHRDVTIKQEYQNCKAQVQVDERSILRALSNLLYNAIKYSWYRDVGEKPCISVRAFISNDKVHVEFENFGVPITKEEIENELIFDFGYRGKYSGDRRRMGTGIGLTDARETARKYGGDVTITSVPASGADFDYSLPFLTTATLKLPLYKEN